MKPSIDFPLILTLLVLIAGIISLLDIIFWSKKRKQKDKKMPLIVDYARSFFPVLLLVWGIRSFVIQPYRVPSGSLEPTILPGDFIVVNQFIYGLRLPVLNWKFINIGEPKGGDIALFKWPRDTRIVFVKRVIGTPGDHIVYKNKVLTVNGKKMKQQAIGMDLDFEDHFAIPVQVKQEDMPNVIHKIYVRNEFTKNDDFDVMVPKGEYFMMGDNRDGSDDSRDWGFVPEKNLIGKAFAIWFSWDSMRYKIRWHRIGKAIY